MVSSKIALKSVGVALLCTINISPRKLGFMYYLHFAIGCYKDRFNVWLVSYIAIS